VPFNQAKGALAYEIGLLSDLCHLYLIILVMKEQSNTWLQLFVDAMTEKDPYKRLALVEQLRKMQKPGSDEVLDEPNSKYRTRPERRPAADLNRLREPAARPHRSSLATRASRKRLGRGCRPKSQH